MATEMLSYRQLGQRLGCSRDAARELVKRLRLPRHKANDGKALVSVDLSEINHHLMPTHVTASRKKRIESKLEATDAIYQAELGREREPRPEIARQKYPARRRRSLVDGSLVESIVLSDRAAAAAAVAPDPGQGLIAQTEEVDGTKALVGEPGGPSKILRQ